MILKAPKDYRYTNGFAFGRIIVLPETANPEEWGLITEEEYKEIRKRQLEE